MGGNKLWIFEALRALAQVRIIMHPMLILLRLDGGTAAPVFSTVELLETAQPLLADIVVREYTGQLAMEYGTLP